MTTYETDLAAEVLRPGDDGYDESARTFFTTGAPAVVVRPRAPGVVAAAVAHAAERGLSVSVRSGAHGFLGHATNNGGMVIDLRHLDGVEVLDRDRRLVRVGAGATWGKVAEALDPFDWGLTSGDTAGVGVGGLTLGGGMGWMLRKHGLAIDNLVGARVVTADGRLLTASAEENPQLFWAIRGGGGNFGVVVDLDFVAQEVGTVHFGTATVQLDDPPGLIARWRDAMRTAPEELTTTLVLMPPMPGAPAGPAAAQLLFCYAGEPGLTAEEVDEALDPLFSIGTVLEAEITERRYRDVLEEAHEPPPFRMVPRNTLVPRLDDDAIAAVTAFHASEAPTMVAIRSLGGAFGRVPEQETAFAHRDAEAMVFGGLIVPPTATDGEVEAALAPWRAVAAHGTGTYLNFQGSATDEDLRTAYPPAHLTRLRAIKRAYDPGNLFRRNHNIAP